MTRSRWILLGAFVAAGLYVLLRPSAPVPPRSGNGPAASRPGGSPVLPAPSTNPDAGGPERPPETPPPPPPAVAAPLPAPNPPSPRRQSPAAPPPPASLRPPAAAPAPAQAVLDSIALNLRHYQLRFGGNPVGTNAEIVRELSGGDGNGAIYLPPDLKRLNDRGELIDEWGTPYFFHQESAKEMEIRSAGADRILWTTDDLVAR